MAALDQVETGPDSRTEGGRQRRSGGRRARAVRTRRRQARQRRLRLLGRRVSMGIAWGAIVVGLGVVVVLLLSGGDGTPSGAPSDEAVVAAPAATEAVLLIRSAPAAPGARAPAAGITLLSVDPVGGHAVVFLPSTSLVEIPGVGLDRLGLAQQYGGTDLTVATVENALGIEIAGGIAVDDQALGDLLEAAGGVEVDIQQRLVTRDDEGNGTVVFDTGMVQLSGLRAAEYWAFRQRAETELDTFGRQQAVLEAVLTAMADEQTRGSVLSSIPAGQVDPAVLARILSGMADAAAADRLAFHLLPVAPFGTADERMGTSYQLRAGEVGELVELLVPGAVPDGGGAEALPVQILNGVGTPGIGQRVDQALEGLGVRIVLSDNARSFDVEQTQIVIYDESPEMVRTAERVRSALGVGTILVSRQPQSVVDLTIVVGSDFTGTSPETLTPGV